MKILRMTAVFGCLDGDVLEFPSGCTVLTMPNESGKSTWAAFLAAMFYGIDTAQRASRDRLPDKLRYEPWSGKPMSGVLELEHNGQSIVLQRTSRKGRPMSQFRAYDGRTGLDLPHITAENCGLCLLGVERSVFCRTAFLRSEELAVSDDALLLRRLENLAVSGTPEDNCSDSDARLKLWQNQYRYHRSGRIPQTEAHLSQVTETLDKIQALHDQWETAEESRAARLKTVRAMETQEREAWESRCRQAEAAAAQAESRLADCSSIALPPEPLLTQAQLLLTPKTSAEPTSPPFCPKPLEALKAEDVLPQTQQDLETYDRLVRPLSFALPLILAALGACLLAAYMTLLPDFILLIAAALGFLGAVFVWLLRNLSHKADLRAAASILSAYGVPDRTALLPAAVQWRDWLLVCRHLETQRWNTEVALEELRPYMPGGVIPPDPVRWLNETAERIRQRKTAQESLAQAEQQLVLIRQSPPPSSQLLEEMRGVDALTLQAEKLRCQEDTLGNRDSLLYTQSQLQQQLSQLLQRESALILARQALEQARQTLEQTYAPPLTALAGQYLFSLTDGRYDGLVLRRSLLPEVREQQTGLMRPLVSLSSGTRDQVWLAMRLAMTDLLLPPETPIWLDDALLTFDDSRKKAALSLLARQSRQVIVFCCGAGPSLPDQEALHL